MEQTTSETRQRWLIPFAALITGTLLYLPVVETQDEAGWYRALLAVTIVAIWLLVIATVVWLVMRWRDKWSFVHSLLSYRTSIITVVLLLLSAAGQASGS